MTIRILFFFFLALSFSSCSSSVKATADTEKRLVFGNGGGFTGAYTTHQLSYDGNVYILLADSSKKQLKKLRKKQIREIFDQADKLRDSQPAFNQPYNMTWFIKYYSDKEMVEYKWGDPDIPAANEIKDLYNQLNAIVK